MWIWNFSVDCMWGVLEAVFLIRMNRLHKADILVKLWKKICMKCTFFVFMICIGGLYISTQMNTFNIFSFVLVLNSFALPEIPYSLYWRSTGLLFPTTAVHCNSEPWEVNNVWVVMFSSLNINYNNFSVLYFTRVQGGLV